jgi:hypothetical protein
MFVIVNVRSGRAADAGRRKAYIVLVRKPLRAGRE